jgi:glycosyltransferase involved in cell wall biosynthesis
MRVLQICHAFPPTIGGVESHVWQICAGLASTGNDVLCLAGGNEEKCSWGGASVVRRATLEVGHLLRSRIRLGAWEFSQSLIQVIRNDISEIVEGFNPDIVHLHNAHHFAPELASAVFSVAGKRSCFNSVHDRVGEHLFPGVLELPWAYVLYASHYLRDVLPSSRPSTVEWLGIDLRVFKREGPISGKLAQFERPIIFHPARLLRWKGVEIGLRAFSAVRETIGKGTLVLCASRKIVDGEDEVSRFRFELERQISSASLGPHVKFLDFAREAMPAAYRAADLIWYPTTDEEPLGLVPIEAMACGKAPIVTASGGMKETVEDFQTGLVVPKCDPGRLAFAALQLLADESFRNRLNRAAECHAQKFDSVAYVARLQDVYNEGRHADQK